MDLNKLVREAQESGLNMAHRLAEIQTYPEQLQEHWVHELYSGYYQQIETRADDIQVEWRKNMALLEKHGAHVLTFEEVEAYQVLHDQVISAKRAEEAARKALSGLLAGAKPDAKGHISVRWHRTDDEG